MRNRLTALTIAVAAVLALTGCGSSTTAAPAATTAAPATASVVDVTGQNAKDAAAALKDAGFETKYDAGDQTVVKASNWTE